METLWGSTARYLGRPDGNMFSRRNRAAEQVVAIGKKARNIKPDKHSLIEEAVLLVNDLNDKAFVFKSGNVDILKKGKIVVGKFPNMKDASLYLLKSGWKYVR